MPKCPRCKKEYPDSEKTTSPYCKSCRAEYARKWRAKNKEKVKEQNQKWYMNGGNVKKQIYDRKRLPKVRERDKERYQNDPSYRISKVLRTRFLKTLNGKKKEGSTFQLIGCSKKFLLEWISYLFEDDMHWNNYGIVWNIDHVLPCSSFDLTCKKSQEQCYHWTNLRPMYCKKNFQKGSKVLDRELEKHKVFVMKWLEKNNAPVPRWF